MLVPNPRVVFSDIPHGLPVPNITLIHDETPVIDTLNVDLNGGILIKTIALSLDPYMRNRMRPLSEMGDMPAFPLGNAIDGFGVAEVVRTEYSSVPVGSHVYGFMQFQKYTVLPNLDSNVDGLSDLGLRILDNPYAIPWRYFVGIVGMSGQSAFYGLKDISSPKKGETLFVSAASGAVGHVVVQLAKSLGLKVIASVGSEEKVKLVRGLGADHVFNWKTSNVRKELSEHGPINIYFDNVGGDTLEAAIENCAMRARIVVCGMVSQYNTPISQAYGIKNLWLINRYRIRMEGFVVIDWHTLYEEEFYTEIPKKIASGELRYLEHVYHGLESVGQGLYDVLTGGNVGKAVVVVSND